jgi:tetratricopeptide (TPR) repeat protein
MVCRVGWGFVNTRDEDPVLPVDARHGQGIAVGTHITQHNYFVNSAALPEPGRQGDASAQAGESRPLRVFISSASGALAPYRMAAVEVCHRLGFTPVHMEEFDPQRPTPEQVCRLEVEGCDVFVLLLAHRYGARPPGQQLSYTELEYGWAVNRPRMPLLAFVVDPAFAWPPPDIDRGADADALARFLAQVRSRHLVKSLAEVGAFREDLIVALKQHEAAWLPAGQPKTRAVAAQRFRAPPRPPVFHAVPAYVGNAPFTGRAEHLAGLDEWAGSADPVMVVEAIGGTGKSALTWEWVQDRAPAAISGLAGRMWWSFYDGSPSMTRFLREVLAYTTGRPVREISRMNRADLADEVFSALRSRPYVLVLDGFERLLAAYHRFDPSKLRDEEVEPDQRSLIEAHADDIVRRLAAAGPSKVLISTRLMPIALQGRFGQRLPGVRHLRLPGLTDADTRTLLARLGIHGSPQAIARFFRPLGNHPLLVGIVAGLVSDYRAEPGGFDRWLTDPTAGGAFTVPDLDLSQRRTHILAAALAGLQPGPQRLLGWISVLAGAVSWATLDAINPFQPEPPFPADDDHATWTSSEPVIRAKAHLDAALKDLQDRGLLWWDRSSNSYDLHPIIRAYAHDQLEDTDRVQANDRVRDHFEALPAEDLDRVTSVEDLTQTITIFRALIGAGHLDDASSLWADFGSALLVDLGAYATVIELLAPLAIHGAGRLRGDLAIAYSLMGLYDEAISLSMSMLGEALQEDGIYDTRVNLDRLGANFFLTGAYAAANRCEDLRAAVQAAYSDGASGSLCADRAAMAVLEGRAEHAKDLLDQAQDLGTDLNNPWHEELVEYWRLYLALVADKSLTHSQLADAATRAHSLRSRRRLAELQCELFIQQEQFAQALTAAQEYEQLSRNAGIDVAPAASAFLLAKLGRTDEATAAVENSLARLPRIHPAQRPQRYLAQTLRELGRHTEATSHARAAYRQAWADGPPNCHHWDLRAARQLLHNMGEPVPDLPTTDPADVKIPLEHKIRTFIAALEAERQGEGK